ncbi:MAG: hypothetical protein KA354_18215 [Phycisphaerae bacterium]|nr:hypothetical protein [Phycisphaerae bacterium]
MRQDIHSPAGGRSGQEAPVYPAPEFTREEKRRIFKQMVVHELEGGFLRYSRREALMRYAAQLKIGEFEATLLIAEAQYSPDTLETVDPIEFGTAVTLKSATSPERWSLSLRIAIAMAVAALIDAAIIYLLFV